MTDKKLTNNLSNNSPILSNSLSDSEILKALECCLSNEDGKCEECPLRRYHDEVFTCLRLKQEYVFDLINRLQAEIENLKALNCRFVVLCDRFRTELKTAKSEAYKEFAERLHCECQSIINQPHNENVRPVSWKVAYEEFDGKVDNLLKELVGE